MSRASSASNVTNTCKHRSLTLHLDGMYWYQRDSKLQEISHRSLAWRTVLFLIKSLNHDCCNLPSHSPSKNACNFHLDFQSHLHFTEKFHVPWFHTVLWQKKLSGNHFHLVEVQMEIDDPRKPTFGPLLAVLLKNLWLCTTLHWSQLATSSFLHMRFCLLSFVCFF